MLWVGGFDPSTEAGDAEPAVACCRSGKFILCVAETGKVIGPEVPRAFVSDSTKSANHGFDCAAPCL